MGIFVEKTYFSDGTKRSETPYLNGEIHGVERHWYSDGSIRKETEFSYGKYHGQCLMYDVGGNVLHIINLKNNIKNGYEKSVYPNLYFMYEECFWKNGVQHGVSTWKTEDGDITQMKMLKNNREQGVGIYFEY